jgi:hypothetical protein
LDTVVLEHDLPAHALRRGDVGAVVHLLGPDAVEVEFVRASGQTQALVEVSLTAIRLLDDNDLLAVRHVDPPVQDVA